MFGRKKRPQTKFLVDGIRCNHCESSIKLALRKVPGVKQVKIHRRKQVVVELDEQEKTSYLELATAIKNAGYNVRKTL